jgi:dihydrofolate reductase
MISIVAAVGQNLELGHKGKVIWSFREDVDFYVRQTRGKKLLVGKKTFDGLELYGKGTTLFVLNEFDFDAASERKTDWGKTHTFVVTDLAKIIKRATADSETLKGGSGEESAVAPIDELVVIGGAGVFAQTLPYANKLYLDEIQAAAPDADVFFPKFDKAGFTRKVLGQGRVAEGENKGLEFEFVEYTRK